MMENISRILVSLQQYYYTWADITVFFVLTPMVILLTLVKLLPRCSNVKSSKKGSLFVIYMILSINMLKCFFETVDLIYLKHNQQHAVAWCTWSGFFLIFIFDWGNVLCLSQLYITQKNIQDPLGYQANKIAKPVAVALLISVIHVVCLRLYFEMGYRNPAACYLTNDHGPYIDEIAKGVLFIVAALFGIFKLDFSRKVNMESGLTKVLQPYILKLDIMAFLQILQITTQIIYQLVAYNSDNVVLTRIDKICSQLCSLFQILFLTIVVCTKKESLVRDGFRQTYGCRCPRSVGKRVAAMTNGNINVSATDELDDENQDQFSALQAKFERQTNENERQHRFSYIFDKKVQECGDIVEMVANLKYINYLLMGMTNLFAENMKLLEQEKDNTQNGSSQYYQKSQINDALGVIDVQDLVEEFNQTNESVFQSNLFAEKYKEFAIEGYNDDTASAIKVTEYAPKIFRSLRQGRITEQQLLLSFTPNKNMTGMYNFRTGDGKSPSFFFFSDNLLFMLKTMKESEFDILMKQGFLLDYYKHINANPDSLLMKIYGIYKIQIADSEPVIFLITENMVGLDKERIKRSFDLKGSILGRIEKIPAYKLKDGTGLQVLKDQNLLALKELEAKEGRDRAFDIDKVTLKKLVDQMDRDTELLQKNALIDYSVFLLQVDRNKMIADKMSQEVRPILFYDKETGIFRVTMKRAAVSHTPSQIIEGTKQDFAEVSSSINSNDVPGVLGRSGTKETDNLMVPSTAGAETNIEMVPPPAGAKESDSLQKGKGKLGDVFKKSVFRIVEKNELESYNSSGQLRGYADIESVDGAFRYKIGIIDFLTKYSKFKYIENQTKAAINQVDSMHVSAIDQQSYRLRFVQYMRDNL